MWDELPNDVLTELRDPRFENRTHGVRGTYAKASDGGKGCRGPLCRKAERDDGHEKYVRRQQISGKVARVGLKDDEIRARDEFLDRVIIWHKNEREMARLSKVVQPDDDPEDSLEAVG